MTRLADHAVLCLGYHPWSPMWKRNQSMMAELARQALSERVVFLNPEVSLLHSPTRVISEWRTVKRYSYTQILPRHPEPRATVLTPVHWVPFRRRAAVLDRLDRSIILNGVGRALGGRPYVLLVNTVRPDTQEIVDLFWDDARLRVFDWSDDFSKFPLDPRGRELIESVTHRLIDGVDHVLAVNDNLAERARRRGASVTTVINATNMAPLDPEPSPPAAVAAIERNLARPVIGYAGFINEHRVDLDLVVELARRHSDWTILFIGPVQLEFDKRFPDLPNIRFLPPVDYAELQAYLALFDVCMIPHLDNPHTAGNNPLKLYDYLTTGRPVVSTAIAGLEGFDDVVTVADSRDAFIAGVERAVSEESREARDERLRVARNHHWSVRARQVGEVIDRALVAAGPGAVVEPGADRAAG